MTRDRTTDIKLHTSDSGRIGIIDGAAEAIIPVAEFNRRLGVDGWIRLQPTDHAALPASGGRLVHFNLGTTSNRVGLRYALVAIVRPGMRSADGVEQLPFVDIHQPRTGLCVEVRQHVAIAELSRFDFAASLPHIRSADALRQALISRYANMHPGLSHAELLAAGCAITVIDLDAR